MVLLLKKKCILHILSFPSQDYHPSPQSAIALLATKCCHTVNPLQNEVNMTLSFLQSTVLWYKIPFLQKEKVSTQQNTSHTKKLRIYRTELHDYIFYKVTMNSTLPVVKRI